MPNPDWLPKEPKPQPLPMGLIILFLLIGIACLAWGGHDLYLAFASKSWTPTPGTILNSGSASMTSSSYDPDRSGNKTQTRTSFLPEVAYSYHVGDRELIGDRYFIGEGFHMSKKDARALTSRYPAHEQATVYFDPGHPESSVLEPGIRARNWSAAIVGAIFTLLGWSAWVGRRWALANGYDPHAS